MNTKDMRDAAEDVLHNYRNGGKSHEQVAVAAAVLAKMVLDLTSSDMSLRDDFAGRAMQGYIAGRNHGTRLDDDKLVLAHKCYGYADAMMKAREIRNGV